MNSQWRSLDRKPEMAEDACLIYTWVKEDLKWQWKTVWLFYGEHSMNPNFRCMKFDFGKLK
jgi:hypothetical protein